MSALTLPVVAGWTIRPWGDDDLDAFEDLATDGSITRWLGEIDGPCPVDQPPGAYPDGFVYFRCAIVRADQPDQPAGMILVGGTDHWNVDLGVAAPWRRQGAGRAILHLLALLRDQIAPGVPVGGVVAVDNHPMLALALAAGAVVRSLPDDPGYVEVTFP